MTAERLVSDLCQREPAAGSAVTVEVHDTLACVACGVTILVLEVRATAVRPTCCGRSMRTVRPARCSIPTLRGAGGGTSAGCCYVDEPRGLVVRCTQSGSGVISCDNKPMKPLQIYSKEPRADAFARDVAPTAPPAPPAGS